jgi:hypothetical protein
MKRRILNICLFAASLLMVAPRLHAWDGAFFDLFQIPYSVEAAALGGIHAAFADGVDTLFSNPAGFRSAEPELSIAQMTLSIYDSALSIVDEVLTGDPAGGGTIMRRAGLNLLGPLFIGYVGDGLGFGLFNNTTVRYWAWGQYPGARSVILESLVFIGGYAFRIPLPEAWNSTLDLGFSIPVFIAGRSDSTKDVRGIFASLLTPTDLVINEPLTMGKGIGIEVGILYSLGKVFSAGIVARNLAYVTANTYTTMLGFFSGDSPTSRDVPLPIDVTVGLLWSPPVNRFINFMDSLSLMADYHNIFDFLTYERAATNPLLHIGIGLELQMLEILRLRTGFYQFLPSAGLSIDLTIFTLNFAVFGRELSQEPGGYPIWGYLIGLSF